jgi:hypothetical protein
MPRASSTAWVLGLAGFVALSADACNESPKLPPPPAVKPAEPPPPPKPAGDAGAKAKMVANPDGLSLAERIAKREANEKKVAAELAKEEHDRLVAYDRTKLPLHVQVFAFIEQTREQYDAVEKKGKAGGEVQKLADKLRPSIVAMGKKMATIDPKGGNSNVTTDYDVMLNALASDYPDALEDALGGNPKALEEQKAELDKRTKKIADWLAELKEGGGKPAKAGKKGKKK